MRKRLIIVFMVLNGCLTLNPKPETQTIPTGFERRASDQVPDSSSQNGDQKSEARRPDFSSGGSSGWVSSASASSNDRLQGNDSAIFGEAEKSIDLASKSRSLNQGIPHLLRAMQGLNRAAAVIGPGSGRDVLIRFSRVHRAAQKCYEKLSSTNFVRKISGDERQLAALLYKSGPIGAVSGMGRMLESDEALGDCQKIVPRASGAAAKS